MEEIETTQLLQQLRWLEDERRKDKAQIATLQERLTGQANDLAEIGRRQQEMDTALKAMQAAVAKTQKFDSMLEEYKNDLVAQMARRDADLKKASREAERVRLLEIETLQRQLVEIKKELPRIAKLEDELPNRRAEEKRLGEIIQRFQPQLEALPQLVEERTRSVPYLEEGRRQDVKRLLAVEQETVSHLKKIDVLAGRMQVLEDMLGKIPPRFEPISARLSEHDKVLDDLRSADFRVQQQVKAFESLVTQVRDQIVDYTAIMNKLREQALINQRADAELQQFQETLRMRVAELGEVERLFEERVKRQFEEFLGEFEKRWSKIPAAMDERWHEHDRAHHDQDERLEQLETFPGSLGANIADLTAQQEKIVQAIVTFATSLVDTNRSSLPQYSVPPARVPEDGVGLPTTMLDRR
jgi:DNA repair exonuclease SbcCD ATPase subunit